MTSWLCSSGSRPRLHLELQKHIGRLPDEHYQLDILYDIIKTILTLSTVGEDEEDLELFGDNVDMNESLSSV